MTFQLSQKRLYTTLRNTGKLVGNLLTHLLVISTFLSEYDIIYQLVHVRK